MPELRSYLKHELPRELAIQVRSYIRMQWPGLGEDLTKILARISLGLLGITVIAMATARYW